MADLVDFQRYRNLYRRALESELNRWGKWIETRSDYEGYPGVNILQAFLMGRGGGTYGHRILCLDMPTDVYSVHSRILRLPVELQEAVWVYYVTRVKADGTLWTFAERSDRLGITEKALRMRVSRARLQLLGVPEQEPCIAVTCQVSSRAS